VLGKPPLIDGASTTICTRFNSRAAPLCPNLDGNLCPTLTAHSEPLPFSELAETGSRQVIHISIRVLGWKCPAATHCNSLQLPQNQTTCPIVTRTHIHIRMCVWEREMKKTRDSVCMSEPNRNRNRVCSSQIQRVTICDNCDGHKMSRFRTCDLVC